MTGGSGGGGGGGGAQDVADDFFGFELGDNQPGVLPRPQQDDRFSFCVSRARLKENGKEVDFVGLVGDWKIRGS